MRGLLRECALVIVLATVLVSIALGALHFPPTALGQSCQPLGPGAVDYGWARRTMELMGTAFAMGFCDSPITRGPIIAGTLRAATITAQLVLTSMTGVVLLAIPLGIRAASHDGSRVTRALRQALDVVSGLPVLFWCTLLYLVLARGFDMIPGSNGHALVTLAVAMAALIGGDHLLSDLVRRVELATREIRSEPYMRTVRAGGFGESRHLLLSLVPPIATTVMARAMFLVSGAIVVELLFDLPGLGTQIRESLGRENPDPQVALAASMALIGFGFVFRVLHRAAVYAADRRTGR